MGNDLETTTIALQSEIPTVSDGDVPDWVQLLPSAAGVVHTNDSRGPYNVSNAQKVIDASFAHAEKLPIDENHALDLAAPKGLPAPARGWIVAMQAREDGIYGRVEWTRKGRELLADRAYNGISPVITLQKSKGREILAIPRASLVNRPNLRGMAALHHQETETMEFQELVAKLLGLKPDASEGDIKTELNARLSNNTDELQSQMGEIGVALGCAEGAKPDDILAAAKTAGSDESKDATIVALQSTVSSLSATVNAMQEGKKKSAAETFVDQAIADRRVGVQPSRDHYIEMHQADPARTEAIINGLPKLDRTETTILPPPPKEGEVSLNAEENSVATQLGLNAEDFAKADGES
ncbi:phage protease [Phaeobacter sp. PT47_59]|uniref:phage protease n=1 Tax=Phaeobacter sp. PT47_59 TaxID=3029979 RepID=UPI00237FE30B|nr:phage protease [Phaeobacter sp. PT47_59]MDE4175794.1 phage protease [Phaeobacter sp. PT47_59]